MFEQEGYDLMGAAFEVYNELGYGMAEDVYQQSLEAELRMRNIPFQSQPVLDVFYKHTKLAASYRPNIFAFEGIVVELKAARELLSEHEAQLFNYMRISRMSVGYLINYGQSPKLEWKRIILNDLHIRSDQGDT